MTDEFDDLHSRLAAAEQERDDLKNERLARSKIDPCERLHNLCDMIAEQRQESPFTAEALELQDQAYKEKCKELADMTAERDALLDQRFAEAVKESRWTCFHCGETFTDQKRASAHFGPRPDNIHFPLCAPQKLRVAIRRAYDAESALAAVTSELDSSAVRDVVLERARQISAEGWSLAHDDEHGAGELALAGACYAVAALPVCSTVIPAMWPWNKGSWKPSTNHRNLVKAAALLIAELERLHRAARVRE